MEKSEIAKILKEYNEIQQMAHQAHLRMRDAVNERAMQIAAEKGIEIGTLVLVGAKESVYKVDDIDMMLSATDDEIINRPESAIRLTFHRPPDEKPNHKNWGWDFLQNVKVYQPEETENER